MLTISNARSRRLSTGFSILHISSFSLCTSDTIYTYVISNILWTTGQGLLLLLDVERAMPYCCDEIYIFPALQQQQGEVALTRTATATRSCQLYDGPWQLNKRCILVPEVFCSIIRVHDDGHVSQLMMGTYACSQLIVVDIHSAGRNDLL